MPSHTSYLGIVVPCADLAQSRIAFSPVAARRAVHVGTRAAAKSSDGIAEAVEVNPVDLRLVGVGDDTLVALAIEERNLAVLADKGVTVSIDGGRGDALLLDQDLSGPIVELGRRAAVGAGDAPTGGVVGKAALDAASRGGAEELAIVVIRQGVSRARERAACLHAVGVIRVGVDEAAGAAGGCRQLVIAVEGERGRLRTDCLAGAVADGIHRVEDRAGTSPLCQGQYLHMCLPKRRYVR